MDIRAGDDAPVFPQDTLQRAPDKSSSLMRIVLPLGGVAVLALAGLGFYFSGGIPAEQQVSILDKPGRTTTDTKPPKALSANQERINRLLQGAEAHVAIGRLKEPPGANAYDAYQMVLSMDPENKRAQQGLQAIEAMETSN